MTWQDLGLRAIERRLVDLRYEVEASPPLDVSGWLAACGILTRMYMCPLDENSPRNFARRSTADRESNLI
jgi:hypothetical protein